MALGDPFSTTYEGAFKAGSSLGEGIQSATKDISSGMQTHRMLQQLGLVKTQEPSVEDYESAAKDFAKKSGHDLTFNMDKSVTDDQKKDFLSKAFESYGIPKPQPKTVIDYSGLKNLPPGMKIPLPGGGQYDAPQRQLSVVDQVKQMQDAQKLLETSGISGKDVSVSPKGVSIKSPSGAVKDVEGTAKTIVEGIKQGNLPPTLTGMSRTAGLSAAIETEAQKQGFNLKQAQVDYSTIQQKAKTAGGAPAMRMETAVGTLDQGLNELDRLNQEYKRTDVLPSIQNRIKILTDKEGVPKFNIEDKDLKGLSDSDQEKAIKYISQLNFTKDTMALTFSGGFAPQEWAYKMATESMSPYYGTKGTSAATSQARKEIQFRINSANQFFGSKQVADIGQPKADSMLSATGLQKPSQPASNTSKYKEGQIAVNPKTHEKLKFAGGQWQKM